ncbi:pentatricopeptide repeat-containing protein At2g22070-like [Zingiber officinale]|uniref:Pentatricopeptide repeat-containing protein n=1 Tax=Zingiber officinale TaxID=94328 RepID=A0A8J5I608_ZINOF|nr:pentatricopeptide repeat-containing protein At2g22070-like [Zingiber officinale]XP_042441178.1 pentatricopeptide repeat-containing protein At2g22070-like [Zingiber officinale]KAG6536574.1 hypothetical protein ZIOFF_001632 [Zingiber officinale]
MQSTFPGFSANSMCIAPAAAIAGFLSCIEQCLVTRNLKLSVCLHAGLIKSAFNRHTLLGNRLVELYSKFRSLRCAESAFHDLPFKNHQSYNIMLAAYCRAGRIDLAHQLFDRLPDQHLVSYNTMILSLARQGFHRQALDLFRRMLKHFVVMDEFTVVSVCAACTGLCFLKSLRQLHASVIVSGLEFNLIMSNVMIDSYGKCGDVDSSQHVFDQMERRDVVTWTSLVAAYTSARRLQEARAVFFSMPERNTVSWTSLISGYEQNKEEEAALELFEQMMAKGFVPNPFTVVSVLSACASLGFTERGRQVHGFIFRRCIGLDTFNVFVSNALIDMYAKCGNMVSAASLFHWMPKHDIVSWNSIITGYAQNGHGKQSLDVFEKMVTEGVRPNHVTFLGVLSACSHAGFVSEGCRILCLMEKEYGVCPRDEHFAAFIDALGRKCQIKEAMDFIECLSCEFVPASVATWGALLGACRVHGNLEIAKRAAESLFMLDPKNGARYTLLSNVYAAAGLWDDARRIKVLMKEKGLKKDPGYSWLELRNGKHMFVARDTSHYETEDIYRLLATLVDHIKDERVIVVE